MYLPISDIVSESIESSFDTEVLKGMHKISSTTSNRSLYFSIFSFYFLCRGHYSSCHHMICLDMKILNHHIDVICFLYLHQPSQVVPEEKKSHLCIINILSRSLFSNRFPYQDVNIKYWIKCSVPRQQKSHYMKWFNYLKMVICRFDIVDSKFWFWFWKRYFTLIHQWI